MYSIVNEEPRSILLLLSPSQRGKEPSTIAVGSLENFYADRLRPGDRFVLDGRCFQFRRTEDHALLVDEVHGSPLVPTWGAAGWDLAPELARRLFLFRVQAAESLLEGTAALAEMLLRDYGLESADLRDAGQHP